FPVAPVTRTVFLDAVGIVFSPLFIFSFSIIFSKTVFSVDGVHSEYTELRASRKHIFRQARHRDLAKPRVEAIEPTRPSERRAFPN
ncbi:MAG: hypothetical protein L0220_09625, partial [Acidobacteria bacterium]|nr:hypothetical protein [Acidobacteriota bacterium]